MAFEKTFWISSPKIVRSIKSQGIAHGFYVAQLTDLGAISVNSIVLSGLEQGALQINTYKSYVLATRSELVYHSRSPLCHA